MAVCDICGAKSSWNISDAFLCDDCFSKVRRVRDGDVEIIRQWANENPAQTKIGCSFVENLVLENIEKYNLLLDIDFHSIVDETNRQKALERESAEKAMRSMLITSGFTFDGYKIVKYSGYISGDDAVQVDRGTAFLGTATNNTGQDLTDALVKIRRQALKELKKAAYDLGCNAVIGVDFDYITLEPETASISGRTTYLPYVFCVTANGNAVVIEKEEETQSQIDALWGYKQLLDNGAITLEEYNKLKSQII